MAKVLPIAQLGAAIIRKISAPVKDIHAEQIQNLIDDLLLTCHNANGMGIAAPIGNRQPCLASSPGTSAMPGT